MLGRSPNGARCFHELSAPSADLAAPCISSSWERFRADELTVLRPNQKIESLLFA